MTSTSSTSEQEVINAKHVTSPDNFNYVYAARSSASATLVVMISATHFGRYSS